MMRTDLTLLIQPDKTQRVSPINISRFEICQNCEKKTQTQTQTINISRFETQNTDTDTDRE